jgi:hypothetical protein
LEFFGNKIKSEPGKASPVLLSQEGESKPDTAKNNKIHCLHPQRGTVFFGYFLCLYKESTSFPVGTKNHIKASEKKNKLVIVT